MKHSHSHVGAHLAKGLTQLKFEDFHQEFEGIFSNQDFEKVISQLKESCKNASNESIAKSMIGYIFTAKYNKILLDDCKEKLNKKIQINKINANIIKRAKRCAYISFILNLILISSLIGLLCF